MPYAADAFVETALEVVAVVGLFTEQTEKLLGLFMLAEECGWVYPAEDVCLVSAKPVEIRRDEQGRLHSTRGPALKYSDGFGVYSFHGLRIPANLSFEQAACICETYLTAYMNLFLYARLADGETVLLHGGGGGVTTAAMQLVKALAPRARIVVTASTGKVERVAALGADLVIDYRKEDFAEAALRYTDKRGVDVILDHLGGGYLAQNVRALAVGGRLAVIGVMGGRKAELEGGLAGRNPKLYQRMLDEIAEYARVADDAGFFGFGHPEHHLQIEGFEITSA